MGLINFKNYIAKLIRQSGLKESRSSDFKIAAYHIAYDAATLAACPPRFSVLDNSNSERPDWFEYWPIRKFFEDHSLNDSTYYGFFSPQFTNKTLVKYEDTLQFVASHNGVDVITFSPAPCHGAFFLNVFEQGDFFHPGLMGVAQGFFEKIGHPVDLTTMVNYSGDIVYSNYFFARPKFWNEWLKICDEFFRFAEDPVSGLASRENIIYVKGKTGGNVQDGSIAASMVEKKIFIMERTASYLLHTSPSCSRINYPIGRILPSQDFISFRDDIVYMDDLKKQYIKTGNQSLLAQYRKRQKEILSFVYPHRFPV